jgi:TetR/AcrR family transcriptional regulator, transcriptional repressor of bet genes
MPLDVASRGKKTPAQVQTPRARSAHNRQRQRLIDACISALHIHGPSRTTVEKVVAIAKMSPGIVRFYFDSKAAMLVASLQFLSAEFEEQVLVPVSKLESDPVAALELLVDLYLDPEIASPRKVSVWYAFWGEASSRQEYYDICGQKDENFAALVRELIGGLIAITGQGELDTDAVALGLIGVLEMLWQDIAFRAEGDIDRHAAKRRAMAYLKSVFPGRFIAGARRPQGMPSAASARLLPGWAYGHEQALNLERAALFAGAWQAAAHESELPRAGDFLTADLGSERVLLLRDSYGAIQTLRNSCPEVPHALLDARSGRIADALECRIHGLEFDSSGRSSAGPGLQRLEAQVVDGFVMVRSPAAAGEARRTSPVELWPDSAGRPPLRPLAAAPDLEVAADWKLLVEQWLAAAEAEQSAGAEVLGWSVQRASGAGWSAARYRRLGGSNADEPWRQLFVAPNQLLQSRPDGVSLLQAIPVAPGRCRLRRIHLTHLPVQRDAAAARYLAARLLPLERAATLAVAASVQRGVMDFGYRPAAGSAVRPGIGWFRALLSREIPALTHERPPPDS